jgi:hypothetical protein
MERVRSSLTVTALALICLPLLAAQPAGAVLCTLDNVPAATLLLPYFELNLDDAYNETTLFSVGNASAAATVAHVVIWTDLGVPTFSFDIYLTGYDVQSVNLRDLFVFGRLPQTADPAGDPNDTISPRGQFSQDTLFPGCAGRLPPPSLPSFFLKHLAAAHTGGPSVILKGLCAGLNHGDAVARGYVTIDAANVCSFSFPGDPGYFGPGGVASDANVLFGDYVYVDSRLVYARGGNLVRLEADPAAFKPGDATFYELFVDGSAADGREPLPTTWSGRFFTGGPFDAGSEVVVWREALTVPAPFPCDSATYTGGFPRASASGVIFDEQERPEVAPTTPCTPPVCPSIALPPGLWATARSQVGGVDFPVAFTFGWYVAGFQGTSALPTPAVRNQAWLGTDMSAHRLISVAMPGTPLDSGCGPAAFIPR